MSRPFRFPPRARPLALALALVLAGCKAFPDLAPPEPDSGVKDGEPDTSPVLGDLACGDASTCRAPCSGGACAIGILVGGQAAPVSLAIDSTYAYLANQVGGTVVRVPLDGGEPATLASGLDGPRSVAVDATHVYWATLNQSGIWTGFGEIDAWPLAGGKSEALVGPRLRDGQKLLSTIAVDAENLYWTTGSNGCLKGGTVQTVPLAGGKPTTLADEQVFPASLAVDSASVAWVTSDAVVSLPRAGGTPTTLAANQYFAGGIAIDADRVYWTITTDGISCRTGAVLSVPRGGGAVTTLASEQDYPSGIAVDEESVYWTNQVNPGAVLKVPRDGGAVLTLACGQALPTAIAVNGASVFWTNLGTTGWAAAGSLMKRTPK